ncbi:hypothetical protein EYM_07685 [Ignicoccus islandicus DSM 13165]|uniref:Uncharacterized protein n=1 Tax=Ignicoccus islandicus DSM 13165 TaxID=940295 RepID=A0A0U3F5E6_9CREN|nr:hypothetical protein [Ignicoccus islandicus]ALU12805.1 hypothetical protein EYM_07685 [Ignicoccus islandicus DSM 13165]
MEGEGKETKGVRKISTTTDIMNAIKNVERGIAILLVLKKDLTWERYILHIENKRIISGEPKIPSERDLKDSLMSLLVLPRVRIIEEGIERMVESAGLDVETLPEDVKRLVQLIPGIELFIPDKELVEANVSETVIPINEVVDEVVRIVENMIEEMGLKGEVKVVNRELNIVISKRVPKKLVQRLEKALKARLGDMYEIKITTG